MSSYMWNRCCAGLALGALVALSATLAFGQSTLKISGAQRQQFTAQRAVKHAIKTSAVRGTGGSPADPPNGMVVTSANAATLASTLLGAGVTISGVPTLQGLAGQAGTFTNAPSIVGFSSGIILSSGNVSDAASTFIGGELPDTSLGQAGNAQLNTLAGTTTFDAAVLSFSFIPTSSTVFFSYTFASAEYPDFVGSQFNDPMGLFVNGTNVALVPGTSTPVTINNVNATTNSAFFNHYNTTGDQIEYNGETRVLTAQATVTPNVPNTIVLGVADASDDQLDSAVFIQSGSLSVTPPAPPTTPIPPSIMLSLIGLAAVGIFVATSYRRAAAL